ncbi:Cathepsin L1 [Tritrichomonas foetus]|uniref:Cathepsin L1 n=1 Tax=Tritrichomonas foetus TaxID=1144522 RepID=A0A1J4J9J0_9EUKA|nr:Cathepsin L1 [Tritrichomonas foetus]|eukprot:OHS95824.1 Cathepsin L1 [Tritrichomonas foetus]
MLLFLVELIRSTPYVSQHQELSFVQWMRENNAIYSGNDYQFRLGVWLMNMEYVNEQNRATDSNRKTFTVGMNQFTGMTRSEYKSLLGFNKKAKTSKAEITEKKNVVIPESLDFRERGVVNEIQNQGGCGSCWAFSAIGAMESIHALKFGELLKLSESNLVDCVDLCYGCEGGIMDAAYYYVHEHQDGKFMLASDYPYTPSQGTCKFDSSKAVSYLRSMNGIVSGTEDALLNSLVAYGPNAVAIDASPLNFQFYKMGVYNDWTCPKDVNHAVILVGYGENFWIVRNSWGKTWGESGYVRMARHMDGICGITDYVVVPIA